MTVFKPGDRVRVAFDLDVDADCEVKLDMSGYWPVTQLAERTGVHVTRLSAPSAVPYSDPRDGDEVEMVVRVIVRTADNGFWARTQAENPEYVEVGVTAMQNAIADGRVTLVKAAAPIYLLGRIYRHRTTGLEAVYRQGQNGVPGLMMHLDDLTDGEPPAAGEWQLMDVVPAEVTP